MIEFMGDESKRRKIYKKYLRYFSKSFPILDIGCGRGVFLELLRENNFIGRGIDLCGEYVDYCRNRGLDVVKDDILPFLRNSKDNYYGGIFAAHIIEHFFPEDALTLISYCYKALKPKGTLVIITPNTKDLGVITDNFWLDASHKRPYPLKLLEKMLEERDFVIVGKGEDIDTKPRVKMSIKSILKRLRFGEFINRGDYFIVGRKEI